MHNESMGCLLLIPSPFFAWGDLYSQGVVMVLSAAIPFLATDSGSLPWVASPGGPVHGDTPLGFHNDTSDNSPQRFGCTACVWDSLLAAQDTHRIPKYREMGSGERTEMCLDRGIGAELDGEYHISKFAAGANLGYEQAAPTRKFFRHARDFVTRPLYAKMPDLGKTHE